jgi:membrane-associated protease RseP (regulator of RpoE activity)
MSIGIGNLLTLLGLGILATYLSLRRGVKSPLSLWLVLLFAPLSIVGWEILIHRPLPQFLAISSYLICAWLYFNLTRPPITALDVAYAEVLEAAIATDTSSRPSLPSPLTKDEQTILKNCFPLSVFYLQAIKYCDQAIICEGQLRHQPQTKSGEMPTEAAYRLVSQNVQQKFGDRFLLLLQTRNPQTQDRQDRDDEIDNRGSRDTSYYFALIPRTCLANLADVSNQGIKSGSKSRRMATLPIILILVTALTTFLAGTPAILSPITGQFDLASAIALVIPSAQAGIPYLAGAVTIFLFREFVRNRVARHYHLHLSLPYFIPFVGSFGCLGTLNLPQGAMPNRRALFDLAIAPSIAGLGLSMALFIWGILQSPSVALVATTPSSFLTANLLPFDLRSSMLMAVVAQAVTWGRFSSGAVDLHPLGLAGCLGIAISAIGLMPLGGLEGGHLIHAMFGVHRVATIGKISRLLLLALSLIARSWLCSFALVLFLVNSYKQPVLDEATELPNWRDVLGFLVLGTMLLAIAPVPKFLMPLLGIT